MGRQKCKRFLVSSAYGKPENTLLPNDPRTVEKIIAEMQSKE